jgi:mannitol/fructose-specific phosphotransferase system IIA component (Ntr-type)
MPRTLLTLNQVAQALHLSTREVTRMADDKILPAVKVRGHWEFRAGQIRDWIDHNLHVLPTRRARDRHPEAQGDLLIDAALKPEAIRIDGRGKTRSSVLRELAELAAGADSHLDAAALAAALSEREDQGSTALSGGVAVPHPVRPVYMESPLIAVLRTLRPIPFGEPGGGLSDLFFLVCCPDHVGHLLHLGRLCRLLMDSKLLAQIRETEDSQALFEQLTDAEALLCAEK